MAEAQTELRINLLGPFELKRMDAIIRIPRKAEGLLSILALNAGQSAARETLATLLWGNSGTEQARQSLRQCLVTLRHALGASAEYLIASDGTTITLSPSAFRVDAHEFAANCGAEDLGVLEQAGSLYRDTFLSGMTIPVETFERWLAIERQRFETLRLNFLLKLSMARAEASQHDKSIAACRQLIALDPLREEGHRLLMTLLASTGNRGGALLQYEQCVETLRDELDIGPDPETTHLAETIRLGVLKSSDEPAVVMPSFRNPDETPAVATASPQRLSRPEKPSVAVLPFVKFGGDAASDYFVQGLMEDVTIALGREKWLFVIAAQSASIAGGTEQNARKTAVELGVRYVLKGSIRIEADQVLFVVQLLDAERSVHLWSGRFQDRMDNIFVLQDRLTTRVAAAIAPALMSVEFERARHTPTRSLSAFDLYLRAIPRFRASRVDNEQALRLLAKAIELDPDYGAAHAMSGRCYQFQLMFGWCMRGDAALLRGADHCREAASKGGNDSEALWMAGLALVHLAGEHEFSQALIERSLTLNPSSANAWTASCLMHSYLGATDIAIEHFERAQRLNPLDLSQHVHWNTIGWAYLGAGRYPEAAEVAAKTLRVQPDYPPGLRLGAVTCALLGRIDEAYQHTKRLLAKQPNNTLPWMRAFLEVPLQRNTKALEVYMEGARLAGIPGGN